MEASAEDFEKLLPPSLTADRKAALLSALRRNPQQPYYATVSDPEPLQGDGWDGLQILRFEDGARDWVKGIVLTNSCDMTDANDRTQPAHLNFVPVLQVRDYKNWLERRRFNPDRIAGHLQALRNQEIISLFYLPAIPTIAVERVAILSDVHTIPIEAFKADPRKARMFSLSIYGFYTFVLKLGVHLCSFNDGIDRPASLPT